MSEDTLSDVLRMVRLRGAVFYYVSFSGPWSEEAVPAGEIGTSVMPGAEHVIEYHMVAKGEGWAGVSGPRPCGWEPATWPCFRKATRMSFQAPRGYGPIA